MFSKISNLAIPENFVRQFFLQHPSPHWHSPVLPSSIFWQALADVGTPQHMKVVTFACKHCEAGVTPKSHLNASTFLKREVIQL